MMEIHVWKVVLCCMLIFLSSLSKVLVEDVIVVEPELAVLN
jgi:hypothetical protein